MATFSSDMDAFAIHLGGVPRQFPGPPRLSTLGWVPCKQERVNTTFVTWNFSLVLNGDGDYRWQGRQLPVVGPCVLTQLPAIPMDYGPHQEWWECFLIYDPEELPALQHARLANPQRPLWQVGDPGRFFRAVEELLALARQPDPTDHVDRIDRAAERALVESLLGAGAPAREGAAAEVAAIRAYLEAHWRDRHDVHLLAQRRGLSPTHFRRLWDEQVGVPPARYLTELRLRRACRLLVEEDEPIAAIAAAVGFADALHFSRRFHAFTAIGPQAYR